MKFRIPLLPIFALTWLSGSTAANEPVTLLSKSLPGRGTVTMQGHIEQGTYGVAAGNETPTPVIGDVAITKMKLVATDGAVVERQLTAFAAGNNPFWNVSPLSAFAAQNHTLLIYGVGRFPKVAILDHQTTPPGFQIVEFPPTFRLAPAASASVQADPQQPNAAIIAFTQGTQTTSFRVLLLTGTVTPL